MPERNVTSKRGGTADAATEQRCHYEEIHAEYERHYYDPAAMEFRRRFVEEVMFRGLDLNGQEVADLASGSGHNSRSLLVRYPEARVTGFDISPSACAAYRRNVGRDCHELDLMGGLPKRASFDVAMIHGGIHHCVANLDGTLRTVASLLKPDGLFLMLEPNRACVLEWARRLWYRLDRYFEPDSEAALAHDDLLYRAGALFDGIDVRYMGGPAYFLILNSLLFRIPPRVKRLIATPLFVVESAYNTLPGRFWFPYFIARWRRRASVA